jgi:hypothetical protein
MHGATPPLPNTSSWRGAYLSTGTTLPLPLPLPPLPRFNIHSIRVGISLVSGVTKYVSLLLIK